jgi:uncharacterized protein YegP (UPF0339 family)
MKFVVNETAVAGEFSWWLVTDDDSDTVAESILSYPTIEKAHRAAADFGLEAADEHFAVSEDDEKLWRWKATRSTEPKAQSAEGYGTRFGAEQAAELVRTGAATATLP